MKSSYQKDLTNNRGRTTITQLGETSCKIRFNVTRTLHQDKILAVSGFMPQATTEDPSQFCNYVFCFRRAGLVTVDATATLVQTIEKKEVDISTTPPIQFNVLVPVKHALGYVRFNRRAFVKNKTVITFTNGIVSGFSASNPSEVVGAIQLPTELLKGVSAAIVIH